MHSDSVMLGNQAEFPRELGVRSAVRLYHSGGEVCARTRVRVHTYTHTPACSPPKKTEVVPAIALWGSLPFL